VCIVIRKKTTIKMRFNVKKINKNELALVFHFHYNIVDIKNKKKIISYKGVSLNNNKGFLRRALDGIK
jgi:hypothetical protein